MAGTKRSTLNAQRWLQQGIWALLWVMPFHTLLVVALGSRFGYQTLFQSWKELLLVALAGVALVWLLREPSPRQRLKDPLMLAIAGFAAVALAVSLANWPGLRTFLFGAKYDLEFLLAFALAWLAASRDSAARASRIILITAAIVGLFGLVQIFLLPPDWLKALGYGPETVRPFALVDPTLDAVRILSTLGGPNQLGSWLVLPLCLTLTLFLKQRRWWQLPLLTILGLVLVNTYSRSAWLGAVMAVVLVLVIGIPQRWRWAALAAAGAGLITAGFLVAYSLRTDHRLQFYFFHTGGQFYDQVGSDAERWQALQTGWRSVQQQPFGTGLGTAGPAVLQIGSPGLISENYYLQLGQETGLAGLLLFLGLTGLLALRLWRLSSKMPLAAALFASLVGISIINLFLHGWTDSSTALAWWSTAGLTLGASQQ